MNSLPQCDCVIIARTYKAHRSWSRFLWLHVGSGPRTYTLHPDAGKCRSQKTGHCQWPRLRQQTATCSWPRGRPPRYTTPFRLMSLPRRWSADPKFRYFREDLNFFSEVVKYGKKQRTRLEKNVFSIWIMLIQSGEWFWKGFCVRSSKLLFIEMSKI